jgi:hypothetical protein
VGLWWFGVAATVWFVGDEWWLSVYYTWESPSWDGGFAKDIRVACILSLTAAVFMMVLQSRCTLLVWSDYS